MKSPLKVLFAAIVMACSITAWSFGTAVDLGEIKLNPGITLLKLEDTKMHRYVDYKINCTLNPLQEKSALAIVAYNLPNVKIYVDSERYSQNSVIPIEAEKLINISLYSIHNDQTGETISFKNLDQTQTFTMHCIANLF